MSARGTSEPAADSFHLPDFCAPLMVLIVVLAAELVALLLTVARIGLHADFWSGLARTSLLLQWIALGGAGALCGLRPRLARLDTVRGSLATLALLLAITGLVSELAWWAALRGLETGADGRPASTHDHVAFTAGNLAICLIVGGIGLRYLYVAEQWRRNVQREAHARVSALQARIRPHFLYNSMNTIAALTRSDPRAAEAAVLDLADLFRANLSESRHEVEFADELEIARTYERIEQQRLGARLRVEWRVDEVPRDALVPSLIVQPLLENAIYHGIERLAAGGVVRIGARVHEGSVELEIANPRVPEGAQPARGGHRIALANIRERLELAYPGAAAVELGETVDAYQVRVRFPLRRRAVGAAA